MCVLLQAPVAAVVLFGLGSVISVLYGVFTFRDCPEEAEALRKVVRCRFLSGALFVCGRSAVLSHPASCVLLEPAIARKDF